MSPDDQDDLEEPGQEIEHSDEEPARSIFSALWFRIVLVVVVLGVIAAVAVPYVLEWLSPPPAKPTAVTQAPSAVKPPAPPPVAAPPATPEPAPAAAPVAPKPAITPEAPAAPTVAKQEKPKDEKPKEETKPARRPTKAAAAPKAAPAKAPAAEGAYFVQVGAFKDAERATRLAAKLREQNFSVHESTAPPAGVGPGRAAAAGAAPSGTTGSDRYDVFVSGGPAADISAKLTAKGLATERAGDGVVVKPSLPLRDAVALSKDLAVEGLKVQVKRARAGAPAPAARAEPAPGAAGETLHRVRVGPFPDLAAAKAALGELEAKGYKGFLARGGG